MKNHSQAVRSCSTFVAMSPVTEQGTVIFGKNSDRPVNESQPLEYVPAADHEEGDWVQCTYIKVPQVAHTNGYIGSRPYNIFGFEHGINDKGVIIGNEAVTGRVTPELQWGLIGMDILRLALARANSAREAVDIMGELLETYGTGGDPLIRPQYFNANYIIADYEEAYVFESCQRLWAAKKVTDYAHIGNIYDMTTDYDFIGQKVIEEAARLGWCEKEDRINISEAFSISDCDYEDGEAYFRFIRQEALMKRNQPFTVGRMMDVLRDHYEPEDRKIIPFDIATSKMPTICCHPGGMNGCASAASAVCELDKDAAEPFKFVYWGSMAPPCCSIFTPKFNIKWVPEELKIAGSLYEENSPWWQFTKLERLISLSYNDFAPMAQEVFRPLEDRFMAEVADLKKHYDGNVQKLKQYSQESFECALRETKKLIEKIEKQIPGARINYLMKDYFQDSAAGCGMKFKFSL